MSSISLRFPCDCNLRCKYCYSNIEKDGLTTEEIKEVIKQAVDLGARVVSIVGEGEPLLDKQRLFELIDHINSLGASTILFTNGILVCPDIARKLFDRNVTVVGTENSLRPEVQDWLSGKPDSWQKIQKGLKNLIKAGFAETTPSRLSIHTIICRQNIDEIPHMWRKWRKANIIPYVQVLAPPAGDRRRYYKELYVTPIEVGKLSIDS